MRHGRFIGAVCAGAMFLASCGAGGPSDRQATTTIEAAPPPPATTAPPAPAYYLLGDSTLQDMLYFGGLEGNLQARGISFAAGNLIIRAACSRPITDPSTYADKCELKPIKGITPDDLNNAPSGLAQLDSDHDQLASVPNLRFGIALGINQYRIKDQGVLDSQTAQIVEKIHSINPNARITWINTALPIDQTGADRVNQAIVSAVGPENVPDWSAIVQAHPEYYSACAGDLIHICQASAGIQTKMFVDALTA